MIRIHRRPTRPNASPVAIEMLEHREFLSAAPAVSITTHRSAIVADKVVSRATKTSLSIAPAEVAAPITFTVTVSASAAAGSPTGTVNILAGGKVVASGALSPISSSSSSLAEARATITLTQTAGQNIYFTGKHSFTAQYIPTGSFKKSSHAGTLIVTSPSYTTLSNGASYAIITPGVSGNTAASGQLVNVLYTGLLKNGKIFDDSSKDGGSPLSFTLGADQVIPGFDAGVTGMRVGETRVIQIPPAEGYGSQKVGTIPRNSTLYFVVELISTTG